MERYPLVFLAGSVLGLANSAYIAFEYLTAGIKNSFCNINTKISCYGVFLSGHTTTFGVPDYILGIAWFVLLLGVWTYATRAGSQPLELSILLPLVFAGDIFTIYLWYVQIAVIDVICLLCISAYVVNYFLTAVALLEMRQT